MVRGCGLKCIKIILIIFNSLICICGGFLLGLGLWTIFNNGFQTELQDLINKAQLDFQLNSYMAAIWVVVCIGFLLFLVGFLGCCGAGCESRCMLIIFIIILVLFFLLELSVAIAALALKSQLRDALHQALLEAANKNPNSLESIEYAFECCGVDGAPLPTTTCPPLTGGNGCFGVIWEDLELGINIVAGIALGILIIELIAIILASILLRAISKSLSYS